MMAEPVIANQIETAPVVNNGTGMAPYMMSVALFVGAISLNLMYDSFTPRKYPKNGISWWASKISVLAAVGICQSLIMVALLVNVNGLAPSSIGKMLLLTILTALVSVSIVMLFNLLFDKVGSFLMLIFLILQLSGSGGTYPIQLSNQLLRGDPSLSADDLFDRCLPPAVRHRRQHLHGSVHPVGDPDCLQSADHPFLHGQTETVAAGRL